MKKDIDVICISKDLQNFTFGRHYKYLKDWSAKEAKLDVDGFEPFYVLHDDDSSRVLISIINTHFISLKEYRKQKLEKLNEKG